MPRLRTHISVLLLFITILISCRYCLFTSYLHLQKTNFRTDLLVNHRHLAQHLILRGSRLFQNDQQIQWKENNKELVIAGIYFEVLRAADSSDCLIVDVIEDKKENKLCASFQRLRNSGDLVNLLSAFLGFQFLPSKPYTLPPPLFSQQNEFASWSKSLTDGQVSEVLRPPLL